MLQSLRHRSVGRRKPPASRIALTFNYRALVLATSRLRIFSHFLQAPPTPIAMGPVRQWLCAQRVPCPRMGLALKSGVGGRSRCATHDNAKPLAVTFSPRGS